MENYFSIQPKKKRKGIGKYFHMGVVVVRFDGRDYEAIITFGSTRDRPDTRGVIGWKILARNYEALKRMIFDIADLYPPKREITVRVCQCDTLTGPNSGVTVSNEVFNPEGEKTAENGK